MRGAFLHTRPACRASSLQRSRPRCCLFGTPRRHACTVWHLHCKRRRPPCAAAAQRLGRLCPWR
ncbi:hypothetical protein BU14_0031s0013 [Porphyra umbilicalis]|uniref:Uncharacterized protein n=1 Tax=Porphyra umbilicalis TaxID=2786 RepID=A0A1X6PIZ8_PORUM|nr:hypothetical protein BU14_0031s0013 [Porphyra umbilicalis]|eukprot:OSX80841.1 hypothetical protein BU14_0031s0013 [Porphyra umbilicalis]